VCSGALPRAVTDNLNFGNPLKPEVYHQLAEAVAGIGAACTVLETPVTGGNVSLYNEKPRGAIYPTPTIGMIGVIDDIEDVTTVDFKADGDAVILLGSNTDELGGSEYLKVVHGLVAGDAPRIDLAREKALQRSLLEAIRNGWIASAHDVAEGGLTIALAESSIAGRENPIGVEINLDDDLPLNALLFGEAQSRVVISCRPDLTSELLKYFDFAGVEAKQIGTVREGSERFRISTSMASIDVPVMEIARTYYDAIPRRMNQTPVDVATALESEVHRS
jgi:phosphoribosylformylglycinamidine synthase